MMARTNSKRSPWLGSDSVAACVADLYNTFITDLTTQTTASKFLMMTTRSSKMSKLSLESRSELVAAYVADLYNTYITDLTTSWLAAC